MRPIAVLFFTFCLAARAVEPLAIDIDLAAQKAFLLQDGKIVYESPISTGRPGHRTPTGEFAVLEKDENHLSSLYGKIVDGDGKTVVRDADSDMRVPKGAKFVQAPMKHFLRFDGATGMHSGYLPGYPASHGCVRMPDVKAELFYSIAEVGTPVRVHGNPPETTPPEARDKPKTAATPAPAATPEPRKWWQILKPTTAATSPSGPKATPARQPGSPTSAQKNRLVSE
ncbi:MAG: L,D-transpeptidase [Chthoniobacter sp.]|uniref:L,D-transpeptidase n=1 Tax=Chthoniobacter sp. TaxID=2510640 RepID=UPI0032AA4DDA